MKSEPRLLNLGLIPLLISSLSFWAEAASLNIRQLEPTPLFPKPEVNQPLCQQARLYLDNTGPAFLGVAQIKVGDHAAYEKDLGQITSGASTNLIPVLDISVPTTLTVAILDKDTKQTVARQDMPWQPAKKWNIYCVSYSHHDLGYGNYPHRLRTEIRHANIERPLRFCTETDGWDEDSRFRFMIETSEPLTSFLSSHSEADAAALGRRVREGRIQVGGVHNTANTEQLSHELMARLFYLSGRHARDLLDLPATRTAQIDDVIGLTWPLATFCAEADIPYFFHGHNGCSKSLLPAADEPVFHWQGPDRASKVLTRSVDYGGYAGDNIGDGTAGHIERSIAKLGANWPFDVLLLQEGTDFQLVTLDTAKKIRAWNSQYRFPRMVYATMDMFFDAIARQLNASSIHTYAKDGNNQWADQDANDAWLLGQARPQGEAIPTAEKLASIAQAVAGGGYPWTDLYQAYHRLLAYHEHTDAIDSLGPDKERMRRYETELEENREMVTESRDFSTRALNSALERLSSAIRRDHPRTIVVFNPMAWERTDLVRVSGISLTPQDRLRDVVTGHEVPWQTAPDGTPLFVADSVPSLGYRTFAIDTANPSQPDPQLQSGSTVLENRFYRITFDPVTGAITSLRDKQLDRELVDQAAPHRFNEYLYERFETSDWKTPTAWHRVSSARLTASAGPVAQVMVVEAQAKGVESLRQTVLLYRNLKRVDFVLDLVKAPSGRTDRMSNANPKFKESLFVALPFSVPEFQFRHELPGCVSTPVADLFDGACTAFYAVRHFSDVSNPRFGVTVSAPESSLVEYGYPRSCPLGGPHAEHDFEKTKSPIRSSRMYLYLMNNMFDTNVRWDQPGPVRFTYSLRSHRGDWQAGLADQFGWDVQNPLIAKEVRGISKTGLPKGRHSFLRIDPPNVVCTTIKPAEANGAGFILRFVETQGHDTEVKVELPFLDRIASANETSLVEEDRSTRLRVSNGKRIAFTIRPFGVKTVRVRGHSTEAAPTVAHPQAQALSDMQVRLKWELSGAQAGTLSHFNVYRGTQPDFKPTLLNLVQRPSEPGCVDQPQLHFGGWINNRLEPGTTYYYRVAAVDRWNNQGPISAAFSASTMTAAQKNMVPLPVECLRAIRVSPISRFNLVNLLWRTSCESDVRTYEIHRATTPGFAPDNSTRIGVLDANALIPGGSGYGQVPIDYRAADYDHLMFADTNVQPHTLYFYRVCAVDQSGQKGPFSLEASVRTGPASSPPLQARASSVYAPEYPPTGAVDGSEDPAAAWISKPYGGGTKESPTDAWLEVDLPRPLELTGVTIIGDHRPVIPIQKALRVDLRDGSGWKTISQITNTTDRDLRCHWNTPHKTTAIRLYISSSQLPKSEHPDIPDGVVRIVELIAHLPDGTETPLCDLP